MGWFQWCFISDSGLAVVSEKALTVWLSAREQVNYCAIPTDPHSVVWVWAPGSSLAIGAAPLCDRACSLTSRVLTFAQGLTFQSGISVLMSALGSVRAGDKHHSNKLDFRCFWFHCWAVCYWQISLPLNNNEMLRNILTKQTAITGSTKPYCSVPIKQSWGNWSS